MIAMQPTDYELGRRSPADFFDRPEPVAYRQSTAPKLLSGDGERRQALVDKAIALAGSAYQLSDAISVSTGSISRWRTGRNNVPDDKVALLEAWISTRRLYNEKSAGRTS